MGDSWIRQYIQPTRDSVIMRRQWIKNDLTHDISLQQIGNLWELKVGEQKYLADIAEISPDLYSISIAGKVYEIKSEKLKSSKNYSSVFRLLLKNQDLKVELINANKQVSGSQTPILERSEHLYPPMPGRVIKIAVKIDDTVKPGDTLLILEAMKMQNEIKASIEGKVKSISVSEGSVVDPSISMIEIDKV